MGAKIFSKRASQRLIDFLNTHKYLKIVAHSAEYDRDEVLGPAFERVENSNNLPAK